MTLLLTILPSCLTVRQAVHTSAALLSNCYRSRLFRFSRLSLLMFAKIPGTLSSLHCAQSLFLSELSQ